MVGKAGARVSAIKQGPWEQALALVPQPTSQPHATPQPPSLGRLGQAEALVGIGLGVGRRELLALEALWHGHSWNRKFIPFLLSNLLAFKSTTSFLTSLWMLSAQAMAPYLNEMINVRFCYHLTAPTMSCRQNCLRQARVWHQRRGRWFVDSSSRASCLGDRGLVVGPVRSWAGLVGLRNLLHR